jgi:hypothetical protein
MDRVELLIVQERFQLNGIGLVVVPDFSVPKGRWRNFKEQVLILTPEGREFEALAQFNMSHVSISDPEVSIDQRWRIVVTLPSVQKEQVPVGCKFFVSPEVRNSVLPGSGA